MRKPFLHPITIISTKLPKPRPVTSPRSKPGTPGSAVPCSPITPGQTCFDRIRPGIYRLKRFPASPNEDLFVAWLRTGPHSVISHDSALALYDLSDLLPDTIHLIVPRTASRRHPGLRLHTNRLQPGDVTQYAGLPVTSVPRTIVDMIASGLSEELVRQAIDDALRRGMVTADQLRDAANRQGGRALRLIEPALATENVT